MQAIPLKSGLFTNHNYRFRENKVDKQDDMMLGFLKSNSTFYDTQQLQGITFERGKKSNSKLLAEIYWSLDVD